MRMPWLRGVGWRREVALPEPPDPAEPPHVCVAGDTPALETEAVEGVERDDDAPLVAAHAWCGAACRFLRSRATRAPQPPRRHAPSQARSAGSTARGRCPGRQPLFRWCRWFVRGRRDVSCVGVKTSAGTLLSRDGGCGLEVLLVHPSGNYNRRAPWSIPKGLPDAGEPLEHAARRETEEETGLRAGELFSLGDVAYTKSHKRVHCFAGRAPERCPPRCASWEVDAAEFVALEEAKRRIHPDQRAFLERLEEHARTKCLP